MNSRDLKVLDSLYPGLAVGSWQAVAAHSLEKAGEFGRKTFSSTLDFAVEGAQFSLEEGEIISHYPIPESLGDYAASIPHLAMRDASLPWTRIMDADRDIPWVALILISDNEMKENGVGIFEKPRGEFFQAESNIYIPEMELGSSYDPSLLCTWMDMPGELFQKLVPRKSELKYFAHCRQADVMNKTDDFAESDGITAIIMCNRLPEAPSAEPVKYWAHLISLEGQKITGEVTGARRVLSLYRWSFYHFRSGEKGFRALCEELRDKKENMLLRFPARLNERLENGYVPLDYKARTGEQGFAWYRSPFTPIPVKKRDKREPYFTPDAAIIYDARDACFDMSLAAAWESGRLAALSERSYGSAMIKLRYKIQNMMDMIFERLVQDLGGEYRIADDEYLAKTAGKILRGMTTTDVNELLLPGRDTEKLRKSLTEDNLSKLREIKPITNETRKSSKPRYGRKQRNLKRVLALFIEENKDSLLEVIKPELKVLGDWLSRLTLFHKVPFDYFVPDSRMLPAESIRFFYIDENWVKALFDGAISLGIDSSRQTLINRIITARLYEAAKAEAAKYRASLYPNGSPAQGSEPPPGCPEKTSGFLLNSRLVSGWKGMTVHPYDENGVEMPLLRLERMSAQCLLGIFNGVPARIELREPVEALRHGADEMFNINLRKPGGDFAETGDVIHLPDYVRSGNVLHFCDDNGEGLIKDVFEKLGVEPGQAALALQLLRAQECAAFDNAVLDQSWQSME